MHGINVHVARSQACCAAHRCARTTARPAARTPRTYRRGSSVAVHAAAKSGSGNGSVQQATTADDQLRSNAASPAIDRTSTSHSSAAADAAAAKYGWTFEPRQTGASGSQTDPRVQDIPVAAIRRPLGRTRGNNQAKVEALMASITEIGLQEPIDVLLVDGIYYGFSGCHRFEAHQRLGLPTIRCRVRKASKEILRMHMM